jgi:hypothetical protein
MRDAHSRSRPKEPAKLYCCAKIAPPPLLALHPKPRRCSPQGSGGGAFHIPAGPPPAPIAGPPLLRMRKPEEGGPFGPPPCALLQGALRAPRLVQCCRGPVGASPPPWGGGTRRPAPNRRGGRSDMAPEWLPTSLRASRGAPALRASRGAPTRGQPALGVAHLAPRVAGGPPIAHRTCPRAQRGADMAERGPPSRRAAICNMPRGRAPRRGARPGRGMPPFGSGRGPA